MGWGDYEYTYPIEYLYDDTLTFAQNVKKLHSRIHLDNSKKNTGSLDCLGNCRESWWILCSFN